MFTIYSATPQALPILPFRMAKRRKGEKATRNNENPSAPVLSSPVSPFFHFPASPHLQIGCVHSCMFGVQIAELYA
jgi:hypothetical protein